MQNGTYSASCLIPQKFKFEFGILIGSRISWLWQRLLIGQNRSLQ